MSEHKGWIGVDLDGTLAHYDHWRGAEHIGDPVPVMFARVKAWLDAEQEVRIFTARVSRTSQEWGAMCEMYGPQQADRGVRLHIEAWCEKHFGRLLHITHEKDFAMIQLWDDRCVQVIPNTGLRADGQP